MPRPNRGRTLSSGPTTGPSAASWKPTRLKIAKGRVIGSEATERDLELLWHCERLAERFGVTLAAAMDEWVSARTVVEGIPLFDAVRFYQANRSDLRAVKTIAEVTDEFVESRRASGVSGIYVRNCRDP